jgi:prepilin-type N-terminal cleavage/methylation domain-containing protein/prepilin-type processing-associated H-X9-DG protein
VRKKAFTLTELLVVIFIIGMLIAIILPALNAAFEEARKIRCATALKAVGTALRSYVTGNNGVYPDLGHTAGATWKNIGWKNTTDNLTDATVVTGNTRTLFTCLVKSGICTADVFICESAKSAFGHVPVSDSIKNTVFDFPTYLNISFSYQNIWGAKPGPTTSEQMVVMADRNPQFDFTTNSDASSVATTQNIHNVGYAYLNTKSGGKYVHDKYFAVSGQPLTANSPNHGYRGQNVLFADGHVKWYNSPLCGLSVSVPLNAPGVIDNIYTRADGTQYGATPSGDGDAMFTLGAGATLDTWLVP